MPITCSGWYTICLTLGLLTAATAAQKTEPEVELLRESGLATDNASLLAWLRRGRPAQDFAPLIRQLGSPVFAEREAASESLIRRDRLALPALEAARSNSDPEIARRAHHCLGLIDARRYTFPEMPLLVVRLLTRRAPPGVVAALMDFLPEAPPNSDLEEEIWFALDALASRAGGLDPALRAALSDPHPSRRALAACLLGRLGNAQQKESVRRLLVDGSPTVRLRAAQGLLAGQDPAGIATLIELLNQRTVEIAWQAEELLRWLAGDTAPAVVVGLGGVKEQWACQIEWCSWYLRNGRTLDLSRILKEPRRPGLFLACGSGQGWQRLYGCDRTRRWQLPRNGEVSDVQLLPAGRVLLVEKGLSDAVVCEHDLSDPTPCWRLGLPQRVLACRRLANGDTWVATATGLRELTPENPASRQRVLPPRIRFLDRQSDGRIVALSGPTSGSGDLTLWDLHPYTPTRDRQWAVLGAISRFKLPAALPLPDGNCLVSGHVSGTLFKVDAEGPCVWQVRLPGYALVARLPNGHALLSNKARLVEMDDRGRVRGEQVFEEEVERIRLCLNLVRLGFPSLDADINRSLDYRLQGLRSSLAADRRWSAEVLGQLAPGAVEAIPALIPAVGDKDPGVRLQAIKSLGRFGPKARQAVPSLLGAEASLEDEVSAATFSTLVNIGPMAVPALRQTLKEDPRPDIRCFVISVLGELHDEIKPPPSDFRLALQDPDKRVRRRAVGVLSGLAPFEAWVVPLLTEALQDSDGLVRGHAAEGLAAVGAAADSALPRLCRLARDPDEEVRPLVLRSLGLFGQRHKEVLAILLEALDHTDTPPDQLAAVEALGLMGASATAAIPKLAKLHRGLPRDLWNLSDPILETLGRQGQYDERAVRILLAQIAEGDKRWIRQAIPALRHVGPNGQLAIPVLIRELQRTEGEGFPQQAAVVLANQGANAVPALLRLLDSGNPQAPCLVFGCLQQMGPAATPAVPALIRGLHSPEESVRVAAMRALGKIGPGAADAVPHLLAAVHLDRTIETLGAIGVRSPEVVSLLLRQFQDTQQSASVRCTAAWGLGLLGQDDPQTVPALLRCLETPVGLDNQSDWVSQQANAEATEPINLDRLERSAFAEDVRRCALIALARLGRKARSAAPVLLQLSADTNADPLERRLAAAGLARMGPETAEAVPVLAKVLRNQKTPVGVQVAVIDALANMGPRARSALSELETASREGLRPVRVRARHALERLQR